MSNLTRHGLCVALLGLSSLAAAAAAPDLAERVAACARERDDAARLACFDRLTPKSAATTGTPAPQVPAAAKSAEAPVAAPEAAATAAAAPAAQSSADDFGLTGSEAARQREAEAQKQPAAQEKVDRVTASVTALGKRGHGEIVVTLDNGQVWAQLQAQYIPIKVGDKVTILAAALHSYRLVSSGHVTPVTRIQ